jgi:hypothetical protein
MFKLTAALMDVAVNKPKGDVDQGCTEDTGEDQGDDEVRGCHNG